MAMLAALDIVEMTATCGAESIGISGNLSGNTKNLSHEPETADWERLSCSLSKRSPLKWNLGWPIETEADQEQSDNLFLMR